MEAIIHSDPAIAAKALRVVNSAYYGLPGHVASLNQACMLLGVQQIRNIVLGMSAINAFSKGSISGHMTKFWLHCFATANAAHIIGMAKKVKLVDLDVVFVGGLLHDIGKLFLFANFNDFYCEVLAEWEKNGGPIYQVEKEILGVTHDEIGGEICQIWGLPQVLCDLVGKHEGPFDEASNVLCFPIHIGDELSKYLYQQDEYPYSPVLDPAAEAWLEFSPEAMQDLLNNVRTQVEAMKPVVTQLAA